MPQSHSVPAALTDGTSDATLETGSEDNPGPSRRQVLSGAAVAAGAAALAGCSAGSSGGSTSGGSTPTAAGGSSSSPAGGSGGSGLVALADVPVGGAVSVTGPGGAPAIVAQPTSGTAVAFSARCTHMGCTVAPKGKELDCPCHGSVYDAFTGKVLGGPAPRPLASIPVTVQGGQVVAS